MRLKLSHKKYTQIASLGFTPRIVFFFLRCSLNLAENLGPFFFIIYSPAVYIYMFIEYNADEQSRLFKKNIVRWGILLERKQK